MKESEQIDKIKEILGLNHSQLSNALGVNRKTLYEHRTTKARRVYSLLFELIIENHNLTENIINGKSLKCDLNHKKYYENNMLMNLTKKPKKNKGKK